MMRLFALALTMLLVAGQLWSQAPASTSIPPDSEILNILKQRVDDYKWSLGIVVGVIEPGRRSVVAYGQRSKGDSRPIDGNTVFEIGSITKVFTSILLARLKGRALRAGRSKRTGPT